MKRNVVLSLPLILSLSVAARIAAYETYHDPALDDQGYCATCHPGFSGGPSDTLHALHSSGADPVTTNCSLCHTGLGRDNPLVMWSEGDGLGCTGCHGGDYGETIEANYLDLPTLGKSKASGYGLRQRHLLAGINVCTPCHADVSQPEILREVVSPPYYARADVSLGGAPVDPCDNEDSQNDANDVGLDNDGDGAYDDDDPDCNGTLPAIDLDPGSLDFGTVTVGDMLSQFTEVRNNGTDDLTVLSIDRCDGTSPAYTWSPAPPFVVAPGSSETLTVTYAPTELGEDVGCLTITSDDPQERFATLDLSGTGALPLEPEISLDPESLDFGVLFPGDTAALPTEIQNNGTVDLRVTGVSLCEGTSAEFSWAPAAPIVVPPGGSETLTVTYAPLDDGVDEGCLEILSDDASQPMVTLGLKGTASSSPEPQITLDPGSLDFATVGIGSSSTLMTEVKNTGTADLTVSDIALCAGTTAEFSWSPDADLFIAPGGSETLSVTYAPVDEGEDLGCLELTSDDPDSPP